MTEHVVKQPLENMQYCSRCCMPQTCEGIAFDEMGICLACRSSEQKMHMNWQARRKALEEILESAKKQAGNNYDCIIPISGGKDSAFQLHTLVKVFGMKPLAVTFSHNWFSKVGWYNLYNILEQLNVDHIMFTPNRKLVNQLAKQSLSGIGDSCWHCHSGVGAFPLQIAAKFKIPLIVWGESVADSSGRATYETKKENFDKDYFTRISAKRTPKQMISERVTQRDLNPFEYPTVEELEAVGVYGIHLGDYIFWDDERQEEFVKRVYQWKETNIEGTYKRYKSAECIMPGVHDYSCYLKRGFGRATVHASQDVRAGLITREEGFELIKEHDSKRPDALDYYLEITEQTEDEFNNVLLSHRHESIKDVTLPITLKQQTKETKKIKPFVLELIDEIQASKD
ncbi:MAG: N-acetyl sugar amidotransferase [Candidatus Berkiella sp.]